MSGKRCTGVSYHSCARLLTNKTPMAMLYLLAEHARDDGYAWPSQEHIANLMNMSIRQVQRTINKLEEMGDLIVKKNRGKGNSNEYLVTPGLSYDQIKETLMVYNMFTNPELVAERAEKKKKSSFFAAPRLRSEQKATSGTQSNSQKATSEAQSNSQKATSEAQKATSSNPKRRHLGSKESQKATSGVPKDDIAVSPKPSVLEPSGSREPSEREPSDVQPSLSNNSTKNKSTVKSKNLALTAKNKPTQKTQPTTKVKPTPEAKKTPPSSAPPPPTGLQATVEALYEACSKRSSRRNRPKFTGVARALHADGFTAEQILLTRRWWDQVGMGSLGKTAPHPSQIEESILEAIAWASKAQQASGSSPSSEEYTEEEAAILEAQLKKAGLA